MSLKEYKRQLRRDARVYVDSYLATHPCSVCGNDDPRVLEFHHVDPRNKKMAISMMVSKGMKVPDIRDEIKKTVVLCGNCHKIHHHEERKNGNGKER